MADNRYFQDELAYLRESGWEFARSYPKLTKYLSERSSDPDVERLLEGFAFLTGRIREKLDDEMPEISQSMLSLLWPNFLRPIPAICMMQYTPEPGSITEKKIVKHGGLMLGVPAESDPEKLGQQACKFTVCYDTEVHPIHITDISMATSRQTSIIKISIKTNDKEELGAIDLSRLNFFLGGSEYSALTLNLWFHRYLKSITLKTPSMKEATSQNKESIVLAGLRKEEEVIPYPANSFDGYRLLQEYFVFPAKFMYLTIDPLNLQTIDKMDTEMTLTFEFDRSLPPDVRINDNSFKLHCSPAINLFKYDADPLIYDRKKHEYHVRPSGGTPDFHEIFSIEQVSGWIPGGKDGAKVKSRVFPRFESFDHEVEQFDNRNTVYYKEHVKRSIDGEGIERYLSLVIEDENQGIPDAESISVDLLCTNRHKPEELAIGDVNVATSSSPAFASYSNITKPTFSQHPVIDGGLHWMLISNLSLNYLSLINKEALKTILYTYDFAARTDRQHERASQLRVEGIEEVKTENIDKLFKGQIVRGLRSTLYLREGKFSSEGDMFLFGTILSEFFALYSSINSFHELRVIGIEFGEVYRWPARIGRQPLI